MKSLLSIPVLALAMSAQAATVTEFTGSFDIALWTMSVSGGSIDTTAAPASVTLISADDGSGLPAAQDMTIAAPAAGTVSFNWSYETLDSSPVYDAFGFLINGVFHPISVETDPLSQFGVATFSLRLGDVFGFRADSFDASSGAATTVISGFSFTEAGRQVPEPDGLALLAAAALAAAWSRRRASAVGARAAQPRWGV